MSGLRDWAEADNSNEYISNVYKYLQKGRLIHDLVDCGILVLDENRMLSKKDNKIHALLQEDAFIRFSYISAAGEIYNSWMDEDMYQLYQNYFIPKTGYDDVCYVTGTKEKCTVKHPNKLRQSGDKAKLLSGHKNSLVYCGRFKTREEAVSVGYVTSQKMHKALRYLINSQGYQIDTCQIVAWTIPKKKSDITQIDFEVPEIFQRKTPDKNIEDVTGKRKSYDIYRAIEGVKKYEGCEEKIYMISVDAATPGRMSINFYYEFNKNEFMKSVNNWYTKMETDISVAPSLYEIAIAAYGINRRTYIDGKELVIKNTINRLFPCMLGMTEHLPYDIIRAIASKVNIPAAYEPHIWEHNLYGVLCSVLKYEGYFEEEVYMNDKQKERSKIWGELLAVLDEIEICAMISSKKYETENRLTNAKRQWDKFVRNPLVTYNRVYQMVVAGYMHHLSFMKRAAFEKDITELMTRLDKIDGHNNTPLTEHYIAGYYQRKKIYSKKQNETNK